MLAARWAYDARNTKYIRPTWHYINFPFKPADMPGSVWPNQPNPDNILRAFAHNLDVVKDTDDAERAVALTRLFHLVGDVHQPLHTTVIFTVDYRERDRGGNLVYIRAKDGTRPIPLHQLW
jgi:hypothetical protein